MDQRAYLNDCTAEQADRAMHDATRDRLEVALTALTLDSPDELLGVVCTATVLLRGWHGLTPTQRAELHAQALTLVERLAHCSTTTTLDGPPVLERMG